MNNKIEKEFRERWEDDTQCGGYIEELVIDLRKALASQKQEILRKLKKLPKYIENGQPLNEFGRFVRLEDIKEQLKDKKA